MVETGVAWAYVWSLAATTDVHCGEPKIEPFRYSTGTLWMVGPP